MGALFEERHGWQLAQRFSAGGEITAAREGVALADLSYRGKLLVEGEDTEGLLNVAWKAPTLAIGQGAVVEPGTVYRLRHDRVFISTSPGDEESATKLLEKEAAKLKTLATVTDMSHAWSELLVVGPTSAVLLGRLCALDFHSDQFPNRTAKQSSVAKTSQLIIRHDRHDIQAYSLIGGRSLAAYLWETILEAGRDLDIRPIGLEALGALGD